MLMLIGVLFFVSVCSAKGEIRLESHDLMDGRVKVDVIVDDVEKPLLGLAFHLVFNGDVAKYLDYKAGELLESGGDDPIYLVRGEEGEVVVGASLKRGDVLPSVDGRVISLLFDVDGDIEDLGFRFEKTVISSLEAEKRVDLEDVEWGSSDVVYAEDNVLQHGEINLLEGNHVFLYVLLGVIIFVLLLVLFFVERWLRK